MNGKFKRTILATSAVVAFGGAITVAEASHFRGEAMVPVVDANGVLTVTTTSYWRKGSSNNVTPTVAGIGGMTQLSNVVDTSDARFDRVLQVHTIQLQTAGLYDISSSGCCRVSGIGNWGGSSSVGWAMNSSIRWDGSTANAPVLFDFSAIQPEVVRGPAYSDSLGATSGSGYTLSYDQALNGIPSQPPGFAVNPTTGQLSIAAGSPGTADYADNPSNLGADYAFSGNITATDGSGVLQGKVEFDWLFDGVTTGSGNLAPDVDDQVINALVGDVISTTVIGTDPDLDPLTWDMLSFFGPGGALIPTFDQLTQLLSWDSTGLSHGDTLIANIRASDGSLSDVGTVTINLSTCVGGSNDPRCGNPPPPPPLSEPGILMLLGAGLAGLGFRRKKAK